MPFSGPKWPICHKQIFLVQTIIITFIYQNFKKILWWTQSYEDAPFLGPKWYICPNFFWKIINIILIYLFAPFIAQNFKKILPADSELCGCTILGPKMAHFPKWEIFSENLLRSLVSFVHAINLLVKYWRLNNTEISLAESHFWL